MSFAEDQRRMREGERDATLGAPKRSSKWRSVREKHLKLNPTCAACGNDSTPDLSVHRIYPFHLFPELELDPANFVTLCESGVAGTNCHLLLGHCGNWKDYNKNVQFDALRIRQMLRKKVVGLVRLNKE